MVKVKSLPKQKIEKVNFNNNGIYEVGLLGTDGQEISSYDYERAKCDLGVRVIKNKLCIVNITPAKFKIAEDDWGTVTHFRIFYSGNNLTSTGELGQTANYFRRTICKIQSRRYYY